MWLDDGIFLLFRSANEYVACFSLSLFLSLVLLSADTVSPAAGCELSLPPYKWLKPSLALGDMAAVEKVLERGRKEREKMEKKTGSRLGKDRGMARKRRGKNRLGWGRGGKRKGGRKQEGGWGDQCGETAKGKRRWMNYKELKFNVDGKGWERPLQLGNKQGFPSVCILSLKILHFNIRIWLTVLFPMQVIERFVCDSRGVKECIVIWSRTQGSSLAEMSLSTELSLICCTILSSSPWLWWVQLFL